MLTLVPLARTRSKISGKFRSSQINSRGLSVKKDSLYIGKIHPLLESSTTTTRGTQKEDLKVIWLSKWSFFFLVTFWLPIFASGEYKEVQLLKGVLWYVLPISDSCWDHRSNESNCCTMYIGSFAVACGINVNVIMLSIKRSAVSIFFLGIVRTKIFGRGYQL